MHPVKNENTTRGPNKEVPSTPMWSSIAFRISKAFNSTFNPFIYPLQNPQPCRLQNPRECFESCENGVAHEDAGLCLDALEGGDRGHLRLPTPPQRVRTPQLSHSLQGEEHLDDAKTIKNTSRCVNSTERTSTRRELIGGSSPSLSLRIPPSIQYRCGIRERKVKGGK